MSNSLEFQMFQRMLSGGGDGWLSLALFLSMLGVVLFKPERITSTAWFRWAGAALGFSIAMSTAAWIVPLFTSMSRGSMRRADPGSDVVWLLTAAAQPILLGLSVMMLFAALSPGRKPRPAPPPQPHPLD